MTNVGQAIPVIGGHGSPDQLAAAIAACQQGAAGTDIPLLKAPFQALSGSLLAVTFNTTENVADLDAAISAFQQAAGTIPEANPVRAVYLDSLAKLQGARAALAEAEREDDRYEQLRRIALEGSDLADQGIKAGDPATLTAAIERLRQALDMTQAADPLRPALISEIGVALRHRFELTGTKAFLDEAVETQRQAVEEATSTDDARLASYLTNLSNALRIRFERTGVPADLDGAGDASRRALDSCAADDPRRAVMLSHRGLYLFDGYRHTGSLDRLNEAVATCQQAVDAPQDETGRAECLMNLGMCLTARFELTGDPADGDAAVKVTGQALLATGPADGNHARYLYSHSTALLLRGERTGSLADTGAAVDNGQQALDVTRPGELMRAMLTSHVGLALLRRYGLTGASADLHEAVDLGYRSVDEAAADDPFRALCLTNLSCALLRRFERDGAMADLNAAVDEAREAVVVMADADPMRPRCLGNAANALQARFSRLGARDDLDGAIAASRLAVAACPADDVNRSSYQNSLANGLQLRFRQSAEVADLNESLDFSEKALAGAESNGALRGIVLAGFSLGLILRYAQTREVADLDSAVEASGQAARAATADDPSRALFLSRLLLALWLRFDLNGAPEDLRRGIEAGRAAIATTAAPSIQAGAALLWGHLAAKAEQWPEGVRAYRTAVDLLGKVAPRGLPRGDQEYQLIGLSGVGSQAAACCLELGETSEAVELLEHGRGVLHAQVLDTNADLTALEMRRPDLAARIAQLRDQLNLPGSP